ncbi:hypothetical protein [Vibrio sp. 99-70-13A1]|uniref:hypothetical protein n=1 Tax=Vibrio sp. 99-70-13A1 TaxID=2607601 RepID=UPI001493A6AF|nr:hypothetical protein [Vibrio sp. 99-70-13A1]NOH97947.1 hypothetical protein [Vibrio sp. 99-70-13A1]
MKKFIVFATAVLINGCGGGSSSGSGSPTDPSLPPINTDSGDVIISDLNISQFTSLGIVTSNSGDLQSVGITNSGNVSIVNPEIGIIPDIDPDFGVITPPACLAFPTIHIQNIDRISDDWRVIKAHVPVHFSQCEFDEYQTKTYLENNGKVYNFPDGYQLDYSYIHNDVKLKVIQPGTTFNKTDNPVLVLRNEVDYEQSVYFLIEESIENGAKLEMLMPNVNISDWQYNDFLYTENEFFYYPNDKVTRKIEVGTGIVLQTWVTDRDESMMTPFKYKGDMYTGKYGDHFIKMNPDGTFGEQLLLPLVEGGNNWAVNHVINDQYIIGDRCTIWDMTNWVEYRVKPSSGGGVTEVVDDKFYCMDNYNSYMGATSFDLVTHQVLHDVDIPSNENTQSSLRMTAPFVMYSDTVDSVYETDHVTINMQTGEKTVEKHFYEGDKVIELKPIN